MNVLFNEKQYSLFVWPSIAFFIYACAKRGNMAQLVRQPKREGSVPKTDESLSLQVGSWLPPATPTCQGANPFGNPIALGASLLAR